jgi:hypothetical protein
MLLSRHQNAGRNHDIKIEANEQKMEAKMNANQEITETKLDAVINAAQEKMEVSITYIRSELEETIKIRMDVLAIVEQRLRTTASYSIPRWRTRSRAFKKSQNTSHKTPLLPFPTHRTHKTTYCEGI